VTTNYYLNGDQIMTQITGSNRLDFLYDENGNLFGFNYNSTPYYYIYNGQGDIIGILDSSHIQVVTYTYDSWGKLLSTTGSQAGTVGALNPFRYRGYYYDSETGLFYVGSRYYDPTTGRFINTDDQVSTGNDLTATNLFAYCGNNPVNRFDPSGNDWLDNLVNKFIAWTTGTKYEPASQQQVMYSAFFTGQESDIYWSSWNLSCIASDTYRSAACADRINEILESSTSTVSPNQKGQIGEIYAGYTDTKTKLYINGNLRIPDMYNAEDKIMGESKNVATYLIVVS